jgi:hypothetical protein
MRQQYRANESNQIAIHTLMNFRLRLRAFWFPGRAVLLVRVCASTELVRMHERPSVRQSEHPQSSLCHNSFSSAKGRPFTADRTQGVACPFENIPSLHRKLHSSCKKGHTMRLKTSKSLHAALRGRLTRRLRWRYLPQASGTKI